MAKAQHVACFFIDLAQKQAAYEQGDLMTNLRLQKLLYFAQGWHLARYGKPLFPDDLCKWRFGPVLPSIYNAYKANGSSGIAYPIDLPEDAFDEDEMKLLLDVARQYGDFSTGKLVSISHAPDGPWAHAADNEAISKESIRDYFLKEDPLPSFDDLMNKVETIEPLREEDGVAVFPARFDDDWGDDDADV